MTNLLCLIIYWKLRDKNVKSVKLIVYDHVRIALSWLTIFKQSKCRKLFVENLQVLNFNFQRGKKKWNVWNVNKKRRKSNIWHESVGFTSLQLAHGEPLISFYELSSRLKKISSVVLFLHWNNFFSFIFCCSIKFANTSGIYLTDKFQTNLIWSCLWSWHIL